MDWSSLLTIAAIGVMFFLMMRQGGGCCGGMDSSVRRGGKVQPEKKDPSLNKHHAIKKP